MFVDEMMGMNKGKPKRAYKSRIKEMIITKLKRERERKTRI